MREHVSHSKVVIAIPCYNEAPYLQRTIDSVRSQSYEDFSVLICDNASSDKTGDIARAAVERDHRFHYFRHAANLGAAENFNFTASATTSPYLLWLGGHDVLMPRMLEHHIAVLDARAEVSVSQSAHAWVDEDDTFISRVEDGDLDWGSPNDPIRYLKSIAQNRHNIGANSVIRRSMLDEVRYSGTVGTDRILLSHLAFRGPFATSPEILYLRRSFSNREPHNSYMKRLTGRSDVQKDWAAFAREYDKNFSSLIGSRPGSNALRRKLQIYLRYHLPVYRGSVLTELLWAVRRARKWSGYLITR